MNGDRLTARKRGKLLNMMDPIIECMRRLERLGEEGDEETKSELSKNLDLKTKQVAYELQQNRITHADIEHAKEYSFDAFNFCSGKTKHLEQLKALECVEKAL